MLYQLSNKKNSISIVRGKFSYGRNYQVAIVQGSVVIEPDVVKKKKKEEEDEKE